MSLDNEKNAENDNGETDITNITIILFQLPLPIPTINKVDNANSNHMILFVFRPSVPPHARPRVPEIIFHVTRG